jgi:hypothetical protein
MSSQLDSATSTAGHPAARTAVRVAVHEGRVPPLDTEAHAMLTHVSPDGSDAEAARLRQEWAVEPSHG